MKKIIFLFFCFVIVIGCGSGDFGKTFIIEEVGGMKIFKNNGKESVKAFEISPQKIFEIVGTTEENKDSEREIVWPRYLDTDSKGNIYILDSPSGSVKKFSKDGTFIKSFGRTGDGPGELKAPYMIAVLNGIVYVLTDPLVYRIVKFDTDGNFIGNCKLKLKSGFLNKLHTVGKDKFIFFLLKFERTAQAIWVSFDLVLANSLFEKIAVLKKYKAKDNPNRNCITDRYTAYAVSKDTIFVAENKEDIYKIFAYDFSGKLKYSIEKPYEKILYSKEELEDLNHSVKSLYKKNGRLRYPPIKNKYKKAITKMYCDDMGRLWVRVSVPRKDENKYDFLIDVFKDGIFLKRVNLGIIKGYDYLKWQDRKIFFKGNRIYLVDEDEAVIKVFEY